MKKIEILLALLLINVITISAQKLIFCADYTQSGQPITVSSVWTISADGGAVYFLFQKNASSRMPKTLNFHISKLSGADYASFDVKSVNPDKEKSFYVLDYKFLTPGSYMVTVKDDSKELTKEYLTIKLKESSTSTTSSTTTTTTTQDKNDYYANSVITSGVSIDDDGVVSGTSPYYTIPSTGAYVIYKIDNVSQPLNSTGLIVDVYKKDDAGEYQFFETKNFDIDASFTWIYFKYTYNSIGDYKLAVYNKEWKYINTSYTIIKAQ